MQTGVVDNRNLKLHSIDKNFIAVKSQGEKRHPRNPEKALIRFQFLEILVRCAAEKYIISKYQINYFPYHNIYSAKNQILCGGNQLVYGGSHETL